jgi:hypothetical protein
MQLVRKKVTGLFPQGTFMLTFENFMVQITEFFVFSKIFEFVETPRTRRLSYSYVCLTQKTLISKNSMRR